MAESKQHEPEEEAEYVGDLTIADLKKLIKSNVGEEVQPMTQKQRLMSLEQQEDVLRASPEYSDYDDVIETIVKPQMVKDPDFVLMLNTTKNPAVAAYNWARTQPQFAQRKNVEATKRALREKDSNGKKTNLANVGGGSGTSKSTSPGSKFKDMDKATFNNFVKDVISGRA